MRASELGVQAQLLLLTSPGTRGTFRRLQIGESEQGGAFRTFTRPGGTRTFLQFWKVNYSQFHDIFEKCLK